jgi:hypothetical protein
MEMRRFKESGAERLGAVVDLSDVSEGVRQTIASIERSYALLLKDITYLRGRVTDGENPNLSRWLISKQIADFSDALQKRGIYFKGRLASLMRDAGFSRTETKYLLKFYRMFPDRDSIRDDVLWSVYKALLDRPDQAQRAAIYKLVLKRKLTKEHDVRSYS